MPCTTGFQFTAQRDQIPYSPELWHFPPEPLRQSELHGSYPPIKLNSRERERARYIERETTYSGLQEHRNTKESTENSESTLDRAESIAKRASGSYAWHKIPCVASMVWI
jgi:hypothetical protein